MKITLFYRHATVIDYAYLDDHLGVVGNSLIADVEFIGQTDHEGVLYDFSYAKKKVKEIIDLECDHRLVVPQGLLRPMSGDRAQMQFSYGLKDEYLSYEGPTQAFCEIPYRHVSVANMKTHLETLILKAMPENVVSVALHLREEEGLNPKTVFHYTHGLKDHYGNCQRLFHGHRNTLEAWVNGEKRDDLVEAFVAQTLKGNIHFCYWENVVNKEAIVKACGEQRPQGIYPELPRVEIQYEANQGMFKGSMPGNEIYFMQMESTVEQLSMHFASVLKSQFSARDVVQVRAYEGIGKGALTTL